MKRKIQQIFSLLLAAMMLASFLLAASAEEIAESVKTELSTASAGDTGDSGIIDTEALDQWAESILKERGINTDWQDLSIGFCYTGTGDTWYWNADVWMYSASMYKVPVSMLMAEKEAAGELTPESIVNGTTLEYLESTALVYSNNDSGHSMVSWLGGTYAGKCSDQTVKYTDLPDSYFSSDFYDVSYYTARYMTQVMKALYYGGTERFPHVTEYLLEAQPGAYYKLDPEFSQKYQIAQKYGAFEERNGSNNNHCAAIIYTPHPIAVVVMTRNVMDYQKLISEVGMYLADYALQLDGKVEDLKAKAAAQEAAAAEAAAKNETEETVPVKADETEERTESGTATQMAGFPAGGETSPDGSEMKLLPLLRILVALSAAVLLAIVVVSILMLRERNRMKEAGPKSGKNQNHE